MTRQEIKDLQIYIFKKIKKYIRIMKHITTVQRSASNLMPLKEKNNLQNTIDQLKKEHRDTMPNLWNYLQNLTKNQTINEHVAIINIINKTKIYEINIINIIMKFLGLELTNNCNGIDYNDNLSFMESDELYIDLNIYNGINPTDDINNKIYTSRCYYCGNKAYSFVKSYSIIEGGSIFNWGDIKIGQLQLICKK